MSASAQLRTLIVDDEPLSRALLRKILTEIPGVEIIGECGNGREALQKVARMGPHLLFLDIQMPGMTGFDVVAKMQADITPLVIFATAFDQYAIDAFDVHAVDYVLKPFDSQRVKRAVERALARRPESAPDGRKSRLVGATARRAGDDGQVTTQAPGPDVAKRLAIRDGGNVTLLPITDIDWVDAAGDYMCVHAGGETHVLRSTMKELLQKLDAPEFRQIHRSTVVNTARVTEITPLKKGECLLHLDHDVTLKVSRNYRSAIVSLIKP
jgi:two-component system LytT family response regulator